MESKHVVITQQSWNTAYLKYLREQQLHCGQEQQFDRMCGVRFRGFQDVAPVPGLMFEVVDRKRFVCACMRFAWETA